MKKNRLIATVLVLTLCLCSLSACTQPVAPDFMARWTKDNSETFVYDVSLIGQVKITVGESERFVDEQIYNSAYGYDEILPLDVSGQYTTTLTHLEDGTSIYATALTLVQQYSADELYADFLQELTDKGLAVTDSEDSSVVLVTTTITTSAIIDSVNLMPISSTRTAKGAYIGKTKQAINDYTMSVEYGKDGKKYTCKVNFTDNADSVNNFEKTFDYKTAAYDNETLFLVMRCYEAADLTTATTFYVIAPMVNTDEPLAVSLSGSSAYDSVIKTASNSYSSSFYRYMATCGTGSFAMYADGNNKFTGSGFSAQSNTPLKLQQGYLVFTATDAQLATLGYTPDAPTEG